MMLYDRQEPIEREHLVQSYLYHDNFDRRFFLKIATSHKALTIIAKSSILDPE